MEMWWSDRPKNTPLVGKVKVTKRYIGPPAKQPDGWRAHITKEVIEFDTYEEALRYIAQAKHDEGYGQWSHVLFWVNLTTKTPLWEYRISYV